MANGPSPIMKRARGQGIFDTPMKGEVVTLGEIEGVVVKRALDGSAFWVRFPGTREGEDRMFTYRRAIRAWRGFPEIKSEKNLTIGRVVR